MLSIEQKRQIFIKSRTENYQASLRLEGFKTQPPQSKPSSDTNIKPKANAISNR